MKTLRQSAFALALLLAVSRWGHAQTPQNPIPISGAPFVITQAGYYRLTNNINYNPGGNSPATIIQVNASNVTIDFNGFFIAGPVGNTSQQVDGISAFERSNLTILNGTIAYCYRGIVITGNGAASTNNVGHRIEEMRVTYIYYRGLEITSAPSTLISDNQISQTGGTTLFSSPTAVFITGTGITVRNNLITKVTPTGAGVGRGIYAGGAPSGVFSIGNTIANCTRGVDGGKYQNNLTYNCTASVTNGTNAGGNYP